MNLILLAIAHVRSIFALSFCLIHSASLGAAAAVKGIDVLHHSLHQYSESTIFFLVEKDFQSSNSDLSVYLCQLGGWGVFWV